MVLAHNIRQFFTIFLPLLLFGAFLAVVPVFVVFLVTNGDTRLLNLGLVGGGADQLALCIDFLIPGLLIGLPSLLRRRLTWTDAPPDVQALLPTWLAIFAAAATAGLVSTLHFVKGGQLANMRPTLVIAAITAVVFLVFPFYSLLARACWQRGYRMVFFDPLINVHQADFWGPNESVSWGTACAVITYLVLQQRPVISVPAGVM